ncbi:MAG: hypothetical protein ACK2UB_10705 [Anaerolineales bacterium]
MITLFAIPKPMEGEFERIQENAIGSWLRLGFGVEILLFGGERGVNDFARRTGIEHIPEVARTTYGTPRVDDLFRKAEARAARPLLGYINADIILGSDFLDAVRVLSRVTRPFLAVGRRWDLDVAEDIDYSKTDWEECLRRRVAERGALHAETGIDYFIYRPGLWKRIPPFAVGRTMWDNWLILSARRRRALVIDATDSIWSVHQNHGYNHHPRGAEGVWKGPEAVENERLAGGALRLFNINDATHRLAGGRIERIDTPERRERERYMRPALWAPAAWVEGFGKLLGRVGSALRRAAVRILKRPGG